MEMNIATAVATVVATTLLVRLVNFYSPLLVRYYVGDAIVIEGYESEALVAVTAFIAVFMAMIASLLRLIAHGDKDRERLDFAGKTLGYSAGIFALMCRGAFQPDEVGALSRHKEGRPIEQTGLSHVDS
jgi:hypothetical protein